MTSRHLAKNLNLFACNTHHDVRLENTTGVETSMEGSS